MFGYIIVNKPEMKIKDYDTYHSFYCGLCRQLKERYGFVGQMSLTYDMTFLAILLTGLYEPETKTSMQKCIAHPLEKHFTSENEFSAYAADMNILLSYYKSMDDWNDEKKYLKKAYAKMLQGKVKKKGAPYSEKAEKVKQLLAKLSEDETEGVTNIDRMAGTFGEILAEIFACRQDEWEETVRSVGFYLGKFIYLLDAYEDIEDDIEKQTYNPLKELYKTKQFDEVCHRLLTMMIAECCRAFETLPIIEHVEILRNILYSGVWYRYELVKEKRKQEAEKKQAGETK